MEHRTPLSDIDISRQQRFNAQTMQRVARQSRTIAAAMVDAANRMRKLADAARATAREQLASRRLSTH